MPHGVVTVRVSEHLISSNTPTAIPTVDFLSAFHFYELQRNYKFDHHYERLFPHRCCYRLNHQYLISSLLPRGYCEIIPFGGVQVRIEPSLPAHFNATSSMVAARFNISCTVFTLILSRNRLGSFITYR